MRLFGQRVDGINDDVVGVERKAVGIFGIVDVLQGGDLGVGIDGEQTFAQRIDLHAPHVGQGGGELPIDVGHAHTVGIDEGDSLHT